MRRAKLIKELEANLDRSHENVAKALDLVKEARGIINEQNKEIHKMHNIAKGQRQHIMAIEKHFGVLDNHPEL